MPEMDGLEATKLIRARQRRDGDDRTPIIAVTASAFDEDRQRCSAAGMDDYLSKPFTQAELADVLQRWAAAKVAPDQVADAAVAQLADAARKMAPGTELEARKIANSAA